MTSAPPSLGWRTYQSPCSSNPARSHRRPCWAACDAVSAERATYLDSSAIVKLAVAEPESAALRRYLHQHRPLVSSALARTEVGRALLPLGSHAVARGGAVLARVDLIRLSDRVLEAAARLPSTELPSLDAIHLATGRQLGDDLARVVTYDERMATAASDMDWTVVAPS